MFETALVMPVYLLFVFVLLEFGHAMMVNNTIRRACRDGARIGTVEGTTTQMVQQRVEEVLASAVKPMHVQVFVKNANAFDVGDPPTSDKAIEELPDLELTEAETRQLFVVRALKPTRFHSYSGGPATLQIAQWRRCRRTCDRGPSADGHDDGYG